MKNCSTFFLVASIALPCSAIAESSDDDLYSHSMTLGASFLEADKGHTSNSLQGLGATYSINKDANPWGMLASLDHASSDNRVGTIDIDETHSYLMLGATYQLQDVSWLKIYPMLGLSHYHLDSSNLNTRKNALAYGVGAQITLADSSFVMNINYKLSSLNNLQLDNQTLDVDSNAFYLGFGYQF